MKVRPYTFWGIVLPSIEDLRSAGGDDGKARLAGGCAGKIKIGPDQPRTNVLIFGKRRVGTFDGRPGVSSLCTSHQENGARLGVAAAFERSDRAIFHPGLFAKSSFEVFGIDVETGGRDDYVLFAPSKAQVAPGV